MEEFYSAEQRDLQERFDSRRLADRMRDTVVRVALAEKDKKFIASCDMFFLSTIDHNGWPTVSYKGGFPGFVRVVDDQTLAFPCYDGNGMFLSMGNVLANGKVGMLFIDFLNPRRFRVHGTATISADDPLMDAYKEASLIVRVQIENAFTNCARYVHRFERVRQSEYVPEAGAETPIAPWKRLDHLQDVLPAKDCDAASNSGGLISEEEYREEFWRGLD